MARAAKASPPLYRCGEARLEMSRPLGLAVLGTTGSIGTQTLDVVRRHPDELQVRSVAVNRRVADLDRLLAEHAAACPDHPAPRVAVADAAAREEAARLPRLRDSLLAGGADGLREAVELADVDCVVNGLVGAAGLAPTLWAAGRRLRIALANKESLVVGGELVRRAVARSGAELLPVDSEHSAIAQCLSGRRPTEIESLVLTASGGPFRTTPAAELRRVTREQVLDHPTWKMGPKITVDSATLMNKGLEVIEAHHLFGLPYDAIRVVVHPASIVHSAVVFRDGALVAQLGQPDMRVPLLYALSGERHWSLDGPRLDLAALGRLEFEEPDPDRFPCLRLAGQAGAEGGRAPIVLNAANEVAVEALLADRLEYWRLPEIIASVLEKIPQGPVTDLQEALAVDARARKTACSLLPQ